MSRTLQFLHFRAGYGRPRFWIMFYFCNTAGISTRPWSIKTLPIDFFSGILGHQAVTKQTYRSRISLNELSPFDEFKMAEAADDTYSSLVNDKNTTGDFSKLAFSCLMIL